MSASQISRRRFLSELGGAAAVGGVGLSSSPFSSLLTSQLGAFASGAALQPGDDYKALVCIFQSGGNDSFNMLVPTDDESYAQYNSVRGNVALQLDGADPLRGPILPINALDTDGRTYGVHPAMSGVQGLFNSGALGFVANVGTLVEPLTVSQYKNQQRRVPRALFSHNDQISQWQTGESGTVAKLGWSGRIADVVAGVNNSPIATNISLGGTNIWQTGESTTNYSITAAGSIPLTGKGEPLDGESLAAYRYRAVGVNPADPRAFSGRSYDNLLQQAYLEELTRSVALDLDFATGFESVNLTTEFPNTGLGHQLAAVARTIAVREQFGLRRQVFYINTGSWDHHQELLYIHSLMLREVSDALAAFWEALGEIGVRNEVTTFTMSDFGRTLRTNGRGTDHAWGGNHMVMGGSVLGQRIHGLYPTPSDMQLGAGLDIGDNGRLLPTTSVDMYAGELATWFGVAPSDLDYVLPNVREFYLPESVDRPIGFLEGGTSVGIARATVATSCVAENGRFDIDLINTSEQATFVIKIEGMADRSRVLGPDEVERVVYTGRHDRDWNITVLRDGVPILETTEPVACDPLGPEVVVESGCLGDNGRIDIFLSNDTDEVAEYEVSFAGLTPRTKTLLARRGAQVIFTGRPDGSYPVVVRRDGVVVSQQTVFVTCDPVPSEPVRLEQSCISGSGRVDLFLFNERADQAIYEVQVGTLAPRQRTLTAGASQQVTVTGRRNGALRVVVRRNGEQIFDQTLVVDC